MKRTDSLLREESVNVDVYWLFKRPLQNRSLFFAQASFHQQQIPMPIHFGDIRYSAALDIVGTVNLLRNARIFITT